MWARAVLAASVLILVFFALASREAALGSTSAERHFSDDTGIIRIPDVTDDRDKVVRDIVECALIYGPCGGSNAFKPLAALESIAGSGSEMCGSGCIVLRNRRQVRRRVQDNHCAVHLQNICGRFPTIDYAVADLDRRPLAGVHETDAPNADPRPMSRGIFTAREGDGGFGRVPKTDGGPSKPQGSNHQPGGEKHQSDVSQFRFASEFDRPTMGFAAFIVSLVSGFVLGCLGLRSRSYLLCFVGAVLCGSGPIIYFVSLVLPD